MDRALDLSRLGVALGGASSEREGRIPTPERLQDLLAEAEIGIFLRRTQIPDELIRTGWYLHGVASASATTQRYPYERQRRAFEIAAHIFDLALADAGRTPSEQLSLAFGAQIGYRRAELDPNATAILTRVSPLLIREPPIELHIGTLALEAGVALLGFQTSMLFDLYRTWIRQLEAVQRQTGVGDLWGTSFGPAHRVVVACRALLNFLAFGTETELERARTAFQQIVADDATAGDVDARWVAAHLLDFTTDAERGSVWRLLPPDVPRVARQAFTLTAPPVLTLWPPQRQLFETSADSQLLTNDARRVVLSIPTSSGKTLLAQLMIVTHLARGRGGVCYVAPMRSLGREVRSALRNRLRVLARELGTERPDFGPMTTWAGSDDVNASADVEVMTPERLAHLLRRDPDAVLERFDMFVFDEAHLLGELGRGFTLESILTFLHWRTKETAHRIVLLSAVLGNDGQVMRWIDPDGSGVPIRSDWRGPRRLHAIFTTRADYENGTSSEVRSADWPVRINYPLRGVLRLRPAAGATPRTLELPKPVGTLALRYNRNGALRTSPGTDGQHSTPRYKMTAQMVAELGAFGSVLVVTSTRAIAQDMARELAAMFTDDPRAIPLADMAARRLGAAHPLSAVLRKGIAFHHAALPTDVLEDLEEAVRAGTLRFMTCTSTLTEGVNLPVRTVVIAETSWDDSQPSLSGPRLINAMGRAGRAGKESEGWIVLVRAAKEKATDFDLLTPTQEELNVLSNLLEDEALEALAVFEEEVRRGEDAAFSVAASPFAEFLAFIWFLLSDGEHRGIPPEFAELDAPISATLAFAQADEATRSRWLAVGEVVRSAYRQSNPERRVYWSRSGTSLSSSRLMDELAAMIAARIEISVTRGEEVQELASADGALSLLAETGAISTLLQLPENTRPWRFRSARRGPSNDVPVDPVALLGEWVHGRSIPDLGDAFLGGITQQDWRVEQIVDAIAQHFEHFLAWTLGVLVELVNSRLADAGLAVQVCEELPSYVRYGVDSEEALSLLLAGVRSRRLVQSIATSAEVEGVAGASLRGWLAGMEITVWRTRFGASSSELVDLIEFVRAPSASALRNLLEQGRADIQVQRVAPTQSQSLARQDATASSPPAGTEEDAPPALIVSIRPVAGEEEPPRLGVYSASQGEMLALVPNSAYGDVRSILDVGVPTSATLHFDILEIVLTPEIGE